MKMNTFGHKLIKQKLAGYGQVINNMDMAFIPCVVMEGMKDLKHIDLHGNSSMEK